jgi:hypothetical protein
MVLEYIHTAHLSTLISVMFSILSCSPQKQKITTTLLNTTANTTAKGYGCNNAKPPRPPHCNTMIDVVVLGCGPTRTGKGAAAPFIGVHILGEIRPAGGFVTLAKSRWEDQIGPSIMVQKLNHATINRRAGMAGGLRGGIIFRRGFLTNFWAGGVE